MSLISVRMLLLTLVWKNVLGKGRINQGRPIDIEDAPYMARVRIKLSPNVGYACDGSILSDMYILTAGHCITDENNMNIPDPPLFGPSNFSILIGTSDTDNSDGKGEVFFVSEVFLKEYSSKNDMGILKLSSRIMLDGIRKKAVTLPTDSDYFPDNRTNAYVDGWGTNPENTDNLLRAEIYTISVEECNTGADAGRDRTYQICTRGDNEAGPCQGDSGGPMLRANDGVQIGVVSLVPGNCKNEGGHLSTFTSVSRNLDWIRCIINEQGIYDQKESGDTTSKPGSAPANNKPTRRPSNFFGRPFENVTSKFWF